MPDFSYECKRIRVETPIEVGSKRGTDLYFCVFQCEDENGHLLAEARGVVETDGAYAQLQRYAENCLPHDCTDEEFEALQKLCEQTPNYEFYNPEWVAQQIATKNCSHCGKNDCECSDADVDAELGAHG